MRKKRLAALLFTALFLLVLNGSSVFAAEGDAFSIEVISDKTSLLPGDTVRLDVILKYTGVNGDSCKSTIGTFKIIYDNKNFSAKDLEPSEAIFKGNTIDNIPGTIAMVYQNNNGVDITREGVLGASFELTAKEDCTAGEVSLSYKGAAMVDGENRKVETSVKMPSLKVKCQLLLPDTPSHTQIDAYTESGDSRTVTEKIKDALLSEEFGLKGRTVTVKNGLEVQSFKLDESNFDINIIGFEDDEATYTVTIKPKEDYIFTENIISDEMSVLVNRRFVLGDTDMDGKVTPADWAYVVRYTNCAEDSEYLIYTNGETSESPTWTINHAAADVDGDGKIRASDWMYITRYTNQMASSEFLPEPPDVEYGIYPAKVK